MSNILDGKYVSNIINETIKNDIFEKKYQPVINILLIGNKPESLVYVNMKKKKCISVGIKANIINLDENINLNTVIELICKYNQDDSINGIMVQLPLPIHLKIYQSKILDSILPEKDVDGLTSYSLGKLVSYGKIDITNLNKLDFFISSTVYGILKLIQYYNIEVKSKNIAIIGNSSLLGMPLSIILSNLGATIDLCNIDTINLKDHTFNKDIIITCCGVKGLITGDMVKDKVIIIDIGINVEMVNNKKKIFGDCDWESIKDKADKITPVPGGVGPMTIASLLEQTKKAYLLQNKNKKRTLFYKLINLFY